MEAVILAGGAGARVRPVVPDLPKPMAPVAGRPFLEILLSMLVRKGFTRIVFSLGYMAEKLLRISVTVLWAGIDLEVESLPLGTGGAIRAALARCLTDHASSLTATPIWFSKPMSWNAFGRADAGR
jgi:D-glycero-alpha-D-manno-heptose 1-phosphate guanylyltransferase